MLSKSDGKLWLSDFGPPTFTLLLLLDWFDEGTQAFGKSLEDLATVWASTKDCKLAKPAVSSGGWWTALGKWRMSSHHRTVDFKNTAHGSCPGITKLLAQQPLEIRKANDWILDVTVEKKQKNPKSLWLCLTFSQNKQK